MTKDPYDKLFKKWEDERQPDTASKEETKEPGAHKKKDSKKQDKESSNKYQTKLLSPGDVVTFEKGPLRNHYFFAIRKVNPEVFDTLSEEVLPSYSDVFQGKKAPWKLSQLREIDENTDFMNKLKSWGEKWYLTPKWALERALNILRCWHGSENLKKKKVILLPQEKTISMPLIDSFKTSEPWEPWIETEQDYKARVETQLKEYIHKVKELYKEAGYTRPPKIRARSGTSTNHFEWLALYQTKEEMSIRMIAKEYFDIVSHEDEKKPIDSISTAINRLAKDIELPLRPPRTGGRPKKK